MAETIAIESLPTGESPPPAPTEQSSTGVTTVVGERYEEFTRWIAAIFRTPANRELFRRAYVTGVVDERVYELLAGARGVPLPARPASSAGNRAP